MTEVPQGDILYNKTRNPDFLNYVYILVNQSSKSRCVLEMPHKTFHLYGEPFYVGKGSSARLLTHFSKSSLNKESPKNSQIKDIMEEYGVYPSIIVVQDNLPRLEAHRLENDLIRLLGRRDLKKGELLNCTGGERDNISLNFDNTKFYRH